MKMASPSLGLFLDIEHSVPVSSPPPAAQRDNQGLVQPQSDLVLNELHPRSDRSSAVPLGIPKSQLPSVILENEGRDWVADRTTTSWKTKWRLLSVCLVLFGNGMNDSAPGALIPHIENHYDIGYAIVSLIFVGNALGFISAAPFTHSIEQKLGWSNTYAFSMSLLATAYVVIICQPPFAAVVVCFFLLGFGVALNLALSNVYCANLANGTTALGLACGAYGIGGTVAPLFATAMESNGIRWSFFYFIPLAVCLANLAFTTWAFLNLEQDNFAETQGALRPTDQNPIPEDEYLNRTQVLKKSIRNRTTLLGALFIFAYQGAEVSISGWMVSFLISYRHGDPSRVGYVSAGFWAGITTGRFLLTYPAARWGEKITVAAMIAGAVVFQLMTWLIPNVISEAVTVAILGVLLGAVYPCATSVFTKLLPRNMHMSSLSFVSALGSSGGAVWPLLTGILSQNVGTMVLHPICLGLYGVMAISWILLPKISKRSD